MTTSSLELLDSDEKMVRYYHPDDLSVHCCSASCNYNKSLAEITYTPTADANV